MKITMVKKQLANGESCAKCIQAEELLRQRGVWNKVDEVVWAIEGDPDSPGMKLSAAHGVNLAPFFIVKPEEGEEKVYRSALRFMKDVFPGARLEASQAKDEVHSLGVAEFAEEYASKHPLDIVRWGLEKFGADCAIAFSGAEDVVLLELAAKTGLPFSVFCLDTGRLHPETYRFLERVRKHYGVSIRMMSPKADALESFVEEKGLYSFLEDGHKECCGVRKVEPLRRALGCYKAWISGQRRDQSPATRSDLHVIQSDTVFRGAGEGELIKLNPLTHWTSQQVWDYIRAFEVPYNPLHERGFRSIGCEPCTRPTLPGEHERAGRWWWEEETRRECGLHIPSST